MTAPEVDVGWGDIAEAFMEAPVIVMNDEGVNLHLQIGWQEVVVQQNPVLQGLMPALDTPIKSSIDSLREGLR